MAVTAAIQIGEEPPLLIQQQQEGVGQHRGQSATLDGMGNADAPVGRLKQRDGDDVLGFRRPSRKHPSREGRQSVGECPMPVNIGKPPRDPLGNLVPLIR